MAPKGAFHWLPRVRGLGGASAEGWWFLRDVLGLSGL